MRRFFCAAGILVLHTATFAAPSAKTWAEPTTGMQFVAIPKGCFQMGSGQPVPLPTDSFWDRVEDPKNISGDEVPAHEVCVDSFWMGKYEVSAKEWAKVMGSPDATGGATNAPVAQVTWSQARTFAERLSTLSGGKERFRLPSEAEWEYACRAGKKTAESPTPDPGELDKIAWYQYREPKPTVVGRLAANDFGLHDMLGNVWEWVGDSYQADGYARHALYNPRIEANVAQRVIRGGSIRTEMEQTRCAKRGHYPAEEKLDTIGFRLIREH